MGAAVTGRARAAAGLLLDMAEPGLYRTNPFRVTGLATNAGARAVRQRRQMVLGSFDLMAFSGDKRLPLPRPPSESDARAAFDQLERADRRLVHELFWWWGEPGECACPRGLHERHDDAVDAHARALDAEAAARTADRERLWAAVVDAWMAALGVAEFWEHVRERMTALADRRLDESTVDGLRSAMPSALLRPQATLARRSAGLANLIDDWPFDADVVNEARAYAGLPACDRIAARLKEINALKDAGKVSEAARRAGRELPRDADLLETLLPHNRFPRSATLRQKISTTLNDCALALTDREDSQRLLRQASRLAVDPDDKVIIKRNLAREPGGRGRPAKVTGMNRSGPLWWTLVAVLSLGLVAGWADLAAGVLGMHWVFASLLVVLLAPVPLTLAYVERYCPAEARLILPRAVEVLFAAMNVLWFMQPSMAPVLWCLAMFVVTMPVTLALSYRLAERWYRE
ncbi:hypothetical protein [Actinocrispum wychmicini]|uniref:Uncharacterized protein n=1 Tax=Actinocrispum wychmicini TaxID=1213861 RepID=A0A4R2IK36_9PSEU|nr:hypothetical protein [Actinocrispum wychmicini]TCO44209.1 hypothetical protein EV192_12532 [Actinocrispum wychmicini]